uniref:Thyroglobulin type-1 domain-containing protein n=1 Tax=Panagrolaimus sp. PS1159 TaxID=55785 RepID=A0AC35FSG1_9BILA
MKCFHSRQIALIREDSYIPECKENGEFQPLQCNRFNGSCFCVDEITGEILHKSLNGPGEPLPLCGLKALFTCEKLPSKLFCEVDGTISQKTERWYRRGDRCSMYMYDYCSQQSHIPPIPLRSKSDCERFCLPSN